MWQLSAGRHLRYGDAIAGWLEPPHPVNPPPARFAASRFMSDDELECCRLEPAGMRSGLPVEHPDEIVNRVGMGCRQQRKTSLRRLQDSADRRSPEIDREMRTDLIDEQRTVRGGSIAGSDRKANDSKHPRG